MENVNPSITFDMIAIRELKSDLESTKECILELLPDVNWNSILETKAYFKDELGIKLEDTKITTLQMQRYWMGEYNKPDEYEFLCGLIELKRVQSLLRNYLDCIIRHEKDGKVELRLYNGEWVMPNRQPQPYTEAITECIINRVEPEKDKE